MGAPQVQLGRFALGWLPSGHPGARELRRTGPLCDRRMWGDGLGFPKVSLWHRKPLCGYRVSEQLDNRGGGNSGQGGMICTWDIHVTYI